MTARLVEPVIPYSSDSPYSMPPVETAPNRMYFSEASFDIRSPFRYATIT